MRHTLSHSLAQHSLFTAFMNHDSYKKFVSHEEATLMKTNI